MNGFALISQIKSLQDGIGPLSGPDGEDPGACVRRNRQNNSFHYITYVLLDVLPDARGNKALYEQGINWSDLKKFQVSKAMALFPWCLPR